MIFSEKLFLRLKLIIFLCSWCTFYGRLFFILLTFFNGRDFSDGGNFFRDRLTLFKDRGGGFYDQFDFG